MKQHTDAELDTLAFNNGFEFVDLGDEWGWRAKFEAIESPHGFATKQEAWESICLVYPNIDED